MGSLVCGLLKMEEQSYLEGEFGNLFEITLRLEKELAFLIQTQNSDYF